MRTLLATIIGLAIVVVAAKSVADDTDLKAALVSAIDDVLRHAIAFSPTFVTGLETRVVEDRIYIQLLIGDSEGEEMMKKLSVEGTTDITLPNHEEAIPPVTILDGQGRVVRVVPAQEFRRRAVTAELSRFRAKKYHRPARTVASVAAL